MIFSALPSTFTRFNILSRPFSLLHATVLLSALLGARTVNAQDCAWLEKYMAPLNLPVDVYPVALAGPAPGDVEQRLVGPEECKIVADKEIQNMHGVTYRQVSIAISGTVFGCACVSASTQAAVRSVGTLISSNVS